MALADSWHIKSRAHHCALTERAFEEGEVFYTALFPDPEADGFLRLDYSQEAWDRRAEEDAHPFSFWRTVYKAPAVEAKVEIVAEENPETLLARLVEEDEAHTENARYILAVMLERKKLLIETDCQKTRGGMLRIYQHRHSGEVFIIKDPQIPLSDVARIQEEVQALLAPKENPPEEQPAAEDDQIEPEAAEDASSADLPAEAQGDEVEPQPLAEAV